MCPPTRLSSSRAGRKPFRGKREANKEEGRQQIVVTTNVSTYCVEGSFREVERERVVR
jgi:hypothetical protein